MCGGVNVKKIRGESLLERGGWGVLKVGGQRGSERDCVAVRQRADQWDVVNQQSDPYALTLFWAGRGTRGVCVCV